MSAPRPIDGEDGCHALIPLVVAPESERLVAVVGMDIEAEDWNSILFKTALVALILYNYS